MFIMNILFEQYDTGIDFAYIYLKGRNNYEEN